jgi:hypothetical protein
MSAFVSCWPSKTACSKKERVADGRKWQSIITKHSKMVSVFPTATTPLQLLLQLCCCNRNCPKLFIEFIIIYHILGLAQLNCFPLQLPLQLPKIVY